MSKFLTPIQTIIDKLGYNNSHNLYYYNDILGNNMLPLSFHSIKVLKELKPYAFYCIDNKPFVLFFDKIDDSEKIKALSKKIWNSQIPVVIFNNESTITIYNGSSLNKDKSFINLIDQQKIDECSESSPFSYWKVTDQDFWGYFEKKYSSKKLNEILLENIEYVTNSLKKHKIKSPTKLILRLIFIRFLIDRGVDIGYGNFSNDVLKSQKELLKITTNKDSLYSLFAHLKDKFNGNLFDMKDELKDNNLNQDVLNLLFDFLSGNLILASGQISLFSMYDFNIIPVELVSNIYEILLGREIQSQDKAFYTPSYLVDYILKDTVVPYLNENKKCVILDPSCGSGIFLVECFRRIVEKNLSDNGYFNDDEKLKQLLLNNIYGVDKNKEAIDVTIFALYLTLLDYKDPRTLVDFKLPNLKDENLIVCDFFDDTKTVKLKEREFNFIIGNPPWGNVRDRFHIEYCKRNSYPNQNKEISRSFVYKVKEICTPQTICCLVLPSKLLYNNKLPARQFRKLLLNSTKIDKVVELSSVRKLIFKNAVAPAIILTFRKNDAEYLKNKIKHVTLKPNIFFKLFNIIVVEKNDIKFASQAMLDKYDWAWKTMVFGTNCDFDIIKRLKKNYPTIREIVESDGSKFITGPGIKDNIGEGKDATHLLGKPILDSNEGMDHFTINESKTDVFNKPSVDRPRDPRLFSPPYCLITTGVNCKNYKMRAAYSEKEFLFKGAIYAIKGKTEQKNILLNLTGLFNSSFFAYLNFMLGSSIGIEREQRLIEEVFEFPYIYSDRIVEKVEKIQNTIKNFEFDNIEKSKDEIIELDNLVLKEFDVKGNPFVDYVLNVQIPLIVNSNKLLSYKQVSADDLITYSKVFIQYFKGIYQRANKYIKIKVYPLVMGKFAIFELVICDEEPAECITVEEAVDGNKQILSKFAIYKVNDLFYQIKDVINFEENSFFIIKSNEYKNWHPAIAQIDLSEVIDQMLSGSGGDQ